MADRDGKMDYEPRYTAQKLANGRFIGIANSAMNSGNATLDLVRAFDDRDFATAEEAAAYAQEQFEAAAMAQPSKPTGT